MLLKIKQMRVLVFEAMETYGNIAKFRIDPGKETNLGQKLTLSLQKTTEAEA